MKTIAIIFSKPKEFVDPFSPLGEKRPVYEELIKRLKENEIEMIIASTKAYVKNGSFNWYWKLEDNKVVLHEENIKVELGYDRSGGLKFPIANDNFRVVDNLDFKKFAWNKWEAYELLHEFMAKTFWVGKTKDKLKEILDKISTDWVVLKPNDGLKGKGIYIGPKEKALDFDFLEDRNYLAQEFVDTGNGIEGIANGLHDLRAVIINNKIVWSHVRIPPVGLYKANAAGGGSLTEVNTELIPEKIKNIVQKVTKLLYNRFDNPIYSIDFGVDKNSIPYVFEINDQMGFPKPFMKAKDLFLEEMVLNFKGKL